MSYAQPQIHDRAGEMSSAAPAFDGLCVGVDTIEIADVETALRHFGDRYAERIYTADELAYARAAPALTSARLAARFAAKEAAIKALNLGEAGISWRDIEVLRHEDGACRLALHGRAAAIADSAAPMQTALSLSHDGTRAVALLVCLPAGLLTVAEPVELVEPAGPTEGADVPVSKGPLL